MKTTNKIVAIIIVMILTTVSSFAQRGNNERRGNRGARTEQRQCVRPSRDSHSSSINRGSNAPCRQTPALRGGRHQSNAPQACPARPHVNNHIGAPHRLGRPAGCPNVDRRPNFGSHHMASRHFKNPHYRHVRPVPMAGPRRYVKHIHGSARPFYLDNVRYYHHNGAFYRHHPGFGYSVVTVPAYSYFVELPFPCRQVNVGSAMYWEGDGSWFVEDEGGYVLVDRPAVEVYEAPAPPVMVSARPSVSVNVSF
jgi:hypothetical protein